MRRFLLQSLLFLLGACLLDRALGALLYTGLGRVHSGEGAGQIRQALLTEAEVVLLGNSRVRRHLDPDVLQEASGLTVQNAGANGQGLTYVRGVAALLLSRPVPPRCLVVNVDLDELGDAQSARARVLTPYLDRPAVRAALSPADPWLPLKSISWLWRFNGLALPIARNLLAPVPPDDGFAPRQGALESIPPERRPVVVLPERLPLDPASEQHLRALASLAHDADVGLAWIGAPFHELDGDGRIHPLRVEADARIARLAEELDVPFHVYDELSHPELAPIERYADPAHLDPEGAAIYSGLVGTDLRRLCGAD